MILLWLEPCNRKITITHLLWYRFWFLLAEQRLQDTGLPFSSETRPLMVRVCASSIKLDNNAKHKSVTLFLIESILVSKNYFYFVFFFNKGASRAFSGDNRFKTVNILFLLLKKSSIQQTTKKCQ